MTPAQRKHTIRTYSGSPDFLDKGASNWAGDVFFTLFYNPWKQGWRSEYQAFQRGKADYAIQSFKYAVVPAILMDGLARGWLLEALGADDDEVEDMRQMVKRVGDYTGRNYFAVPIGWADDTRSKALVVKLPLSDAQKMIYATTRAMLNGDPANAAAIGVDHLMGNFMGDAGTPWAKIIKANYAHYVKGQNPIDTRTGRTILDPDVNAARNLTADDDIDMLKWTWNTSGLGGIVHRFRLGLDPAEQLREGNIERALKWPGLSVAMGRWLSVEDRGLADAAARVVEPIEAQRAATRLQVDRYIAGQVTEPEAIQALQADPYANEYLARRLADLRRQGPNSLTRTLERTPAYARPAVMRELAP